MKLFGIYGAGGCGRGIAPFARNGLSPDTKIVFIDEKFEAAHCNGLKVMRRAEFLEKAGMGSKLVIAVADPAIRRRLVDSMSDGKAEFATIFATNSVVMDEVSISEGSLFSPFTCLTSNIRIGRHFHCNLYSYVEHDCVIGDFVTFAPSVRCNGNVTIGAGAYIGANSVIRQGLNIGENAVIGMGAVVTKDVPCGETWVGNPAQKLTK